MTGLKPTAHSSFEPIPIRTHHLSRRSLPTVLKNQLTKRSSSRRRRSKMTEALVRNKPGSASVKNMPIIQDGPPPGGFPPVRFTRRIPNKSPSAVAIFITTFSVFCWGMYQVGKGNKIRSRKPQRFRPF